MQLHADLEVVDGALAGSMLDKVMRLPYISPISPLYLVYISSISRPYLSHISRVSRPYLGAPPKVMRLLGGDADAIEAAKHAAKVAPLDLPHISPVSLLTSHISLLDLP